MFGNGVHASENVPIATRGSTISTAIKHFGAKNFSAFLRNVLTSFFVFSSERKPPKIDHYYNVVMDPPSFVNYYFMAQLYFLTLGWLNKYLLKLLNFLVLVLFSIRLIFSYTYRLSTPKFPFIKNCKVFSVKMQKYAKS